MAQRRVGLFDGPSPLYAAYGSNLDRDDLLRWCAETGHSMPLGDALGRAWLPDRRLAFTEYGARRVGGVLDVVPARGAVTPCALFAVDESALNALDAKESLGVLYRRFESVALTDTMGSHRVVTYEILPERRKEFVEPHPDYVGVVRRGLAARGHDADASAMLDAATRGDGASATIPNVFVYGTLMPGECRHHVLREHGLSTIESATVAGRLVDLGHYPGLVAPQNAEEWVAGYVATVDDVDGLLRRLDRIEGFGGWLDETPLYWRRLVRAATAQASLLAWTYHFAGPVDRATPVVGGRWK